MKKIISLSLVAILSGLAVSAQDTTSMQSKQKKSFDTIPNPSDTSKRNKNWDNNKMPKDKQKPVANWPDSLKKRDSL